MRLAALIGAIGMSAMASAAFGVATPIIHIDAGDVVKDGSNNVSSMTELTGSGDGFGGDFTQASAGLQPLWVPNVLNGHPVVRFSGGQVVQGSLPASNTTLPDVTLIVVTHGVSNPQNLFDESPNKPNPLRFLNPNRVATQFNDNGGIPVSMVPVSPGGVEIFTVTVHSDVPNNNLTWHGFLNGNSYAGGDIVYPVGSGRNTAISAPALGATNLGTAGFFTGDVAELYFFNSAISDADRQFYESSLLAEYVPEPASLGVLALGALALLRRRGHAAE